ncbi:MAG: hypothetical protein ACOCVA_06325 [Prolixibacteraceae bacterium]
MTVFSFFLLLGYLSSAAQNPARFNEHMNKKGYDIWEEVLNDYMH